MTSTIIANYKNENSNFIILDNEHPSRHESKMKIFKLAKLEDLKKINIKTDKFTLEQVYYLIKFIQEHKYFYFDEDEVSCIEGGMGGIINLISYINNTETKKENIFNFILKKKNTDIVIEKFISYTDLIFYFNDENLYKADVDLYILNDEGDYIKQTYLVLYTYKGEINPNTEENEMLFDDLDKKYYNLIGNKK